ncbi:ubiquitin-conjugating enzyme E2 Z-like [Bradysia coprophila]|uniref:ubiquitin-conjugating enzyme E2 Z-like n=1 Tax=Bradysia coprophila TaxID=38358 RepID=UPI00187D9B39|nr:ubiquitin-conjugating enzyme E2 Z-like [Bradysia coprophila]XP_037031300.1 ubiquitin-conjugating enzyme E2 Z-like [Bradysia coprophila]
MTSEIKGKTHTLRIMNDIREFYEENIDGIYIVPDEDNICLIHALLIGPPETPYENGFFYFVLKYPDTYPLKPPDVQNRTTSRKTVRFSPNLYANGKVCLSILGTWEGPSWCSSQTILSTLVSIRSLMDANPYYNEPGHEKTRTNKSVDVEKRVSDYNNIIVHETLRVAVAEMLQEYNADTYGMPGALREIMISYFKANYQFYENVIESNRDMDGQLVNDPYRDIHRPKTFDYKRILEKIVKLKETLSDVDENSTPTYKAISTKTLKASCRDVLKSEECCDDYMDYIEVEEDDEDADASALYDPESDNE